MLCLLVVASTTRAMLHRKGVYTNIVVSISVKGVVMYTHTRKQSGNELSYVTYEQYTTYAQRQQHNVHGVIRHAHSNPSIVYTRTLLCVQHLT